MLVLSYWLKTVLFWNGVQGNLQKGWLETAMHYNSMRKVYDNLTMSKKIIHLERNPPKWWGPRLQPIKPLGKYGIVVNTETTLTVRCYIFLLNIDFLGNESYSYFSPPVFSGVRAQALVSFKKYMPPPLPYFGRGGGIHFLNETSACGFVVYI